MQCAVDGGKHVDLIRLDVVDDSKGAFQYLNFHFSRPNSARSDWTLVVRAA